MQRHCCTTCEKHSRSPVILPQLCLWSVPLSASPKTCTVSCSSRKKLCQHAERAGSTNDYSRKRFSRIKVCKPKPYCSGTVLSYHSSHTRWRVSKAEDPWIIQKQTVPSLVNNLAACTGAATTKHWLVFRPLQAQKAQAVRQKECIHLFLNQVKQRQFVRQALMEKLI